MQTVLDHNQAEKIQSTTLLNRACQYPLIRYMGSKYKLLPWIYDQLKPLKFRIVLDAFAGSGAVSYLFKTMQKTVLSNDFLHFSYILTKATVENSFQKLSKQDLSRLLQKTKNAPSFIADTYSGIFFSDEELNFLDTISYNLAGLGNQYKKALAMTCLLRSCVKKQPRGVFTISGNMEKYNDGRRDLKLSLHEHFLEQIGIYNNIVFSNGQAHKSFNTEIFQSDEEKYAPELVYMDPPYVPHSDDNCYIKRYHFLEGLFKYWQDEEILQHNKVKKIKKKFTPFSYRRTALEGFKDLFKKFSGSIIVLSYSSNGYPDLETLVSLMREYKKTVEVKFKDHRYHFGNHKAVTRAQVKEYLIIGR